MGKVLRQKRFTVVDTMVEAVLAQNDVQYRRLIALLEEELADFHGKRIGLGPGLQGRDG